MLKNPWRLMAASAAAVSCAVLAALFLTAQTPQPSQSSTPQSLNEGVRYLHQAAPFLQKNCETCHNDSLAQHNVNLQQLLAEPDTLGKNLTTWQDVVFQMQSGAMPPKGAPQPTEAEKRSEMRFLIQAIRSTPRAAAPPPIKEPAPTDDWLTFSYTPERSGWVSVDPDITKANAHDIHLLWQYQTSTKGIPLNVYSTLTEPLVVNDVETAQGSKNLVYVASRDDHVYAIDAQKGTLVWEKYFPYTAKPLVRANGACPENLNATPVVDLQKKILYVLTNDGKLRGLSLSNGASRFTPTQFVPPYSRNFSLNLVDGRIATGTTRGCAGVPSQVAVMDVNDPTHPVQHFFTSPGKGSGPWGRGGIVSTPYGWITQTADGYYDPAAGRFGDSVLDLTPSGMLTDSFTPPDQKAIDARDLDLGSSSPVVFQFHGRTLAATAGKQGVIYLLDVKNLGGSTHRKALYTSPRWSNDAERFGYNGMWSVMSTYVDSQGRRWLLAPFYGPPAKATIGKFPKTHGKTINGQLMAFTVEGTADHPYLKPQWVSADLDLPGVAVVSNNVILILADGDRGATLVRRNFRRPRPAGKPGQPPMRRFTPRPLPSLEVNSALPGWQDDAEWRAAQMRPFVQGGQMPGRRYTGGRETTHAVLYVLDAQTGDQLYSSDDAMDSFNHYGGLALSKGNVYVSTWAGKVFALGLGSK